jgi:peptide/nickel transport system permease protein
MKESEIIFRTILPNELPLILAYGAFSAVSAVILEVGLDFIGLGSISNLSWGVMLYFAEGYDALLRGSWWWFLPPGIMVAVLGTGLMLLGYGITQSRRTSNR